MSCVFGKGKRGAVVEVSTSSPDTSVTSLVAQHSINFGAKPMLSEADVNVLLSQVLKDPVEVATVR